MHCRRVDRPLISRRLLPLVLSPLDGLALVPGRVVVTDWQLVLKPGVRGGRGSSERPYSALALSACLADTEWWRGTLAGWVGAVACTCHPSIRMTYWFTRKMPFMAPPWARDSINGIVPLPYNVATSTGYSSTRVTAVSGTFWSSISLNEWLVNHCGLNQKISSHILNWRKKEWWTVLTGKYVLRIEKLRGLFDTLWCDP